jgi:hypothetical protein
MESGGRETFNGLKNTIEGSDAVKAAFICYIDNWVC